MSLAARPPAVAGSFYPGSAGELRAEVDRCLGPRRRERPPIAAVVPHAGYVYSGLTAGCLFGAFPFPRRVILLGPNHSGLGLPGSVDSSERWRTPLGEVEIDDELRAELLAASELLELDAGAHRREHCLEVEVPFLQVVQPDVRIVPVVLAWHELDELEALGRALATVVRGSPEAVLLLASSDLNHYESHDETIVKDERALEPLLALDPAELYRRVVAENISMCGIVPTVAVLFAARTLGATEAVLLDHRTSADAFGERDRTVGYASVWIG